MFKTVDEVKGDIKGAIVSLERQELRIGIKTF